MTNLCDTVHPLWKPFFQKEEAEVKSILAKLCTSEGHSEITPEWDRIFRFASFDPVNLQVVILGQEPYPQKGAATGRSFEVGGMTDWNTSIAEAVQSFISFEVG